MMLARNLLLLAFFGLLPCTLSALDQDDGLDALDVDETAVHAVPSPLAENLPEEPLRTTLTPPPTNQPIPVPVPEQTPLQRTTPIEPPAPVPAPVLQPTTTAPQAVAQQGWPQLALLGAFLSASIAAIASLAILFSTLQKPVAKQQNFTQSPDIDGAVKRALQPLQEQLGAVLAKIENASALHTDAQSVESVHDTHLTNKLAALDDAIADSRDEIREINKAIATLENGNTSVQKGLDTILQRIPDPLAVKELHDEPDPVPEPEAKPSDSLNEWLPAPLREGGRLTSASAELLKHCVQKQPEARKLLSALIDWEATNNTKDMQLMAQQTHILGKALFAWLRTQLGEDSDRAIECIQTWTKAFKVLIEAQFSQLSLLAVYPDDRFDTDRMEAVRSMSSARITVQMPLSWLIVEKSESRERILHRAEVITA